MTLLASPVRPVANRLLSRLPAEDAARLQRRMQPVQLVTGQRVTDAGITPSLVWFPETAVVSLLTVMNDGASVEVATVGREGIIGLPVFLGTEALPWSAVAQVTGAAWRMDAFAFREELARSPSLADAVRRHMQALLVQIGQSVVCNRLHPVDQRAARWLLMTGDRVGRDEFRLTQEFVAVMLGVHRPSVTVAEVRLQRAGLIAYRRGNLQILDRPGLEAAACECYRTVKTEQDRLLG